MRKLLRSAFVLALVLGLGACGNQKKQPQEKFDETILKDTSAGVDGYALLGPSALYVGDKQLADWGKFDGSVGKMEATSVAKVAEFDVELARTLASRKLKALYVLKDIHVGDKALAGWDTTYGDDEKKADGVYCLKAGTYADDPDTQKSAVSTWVPSKESGKVESLTPKSYWITSNFQEEKDPHGYDWNTNPVVTSGAGVYTMVVARYTEQHDGSGFGIGVHLQEAKPQYVPATFDHYHLTGTMNSWDNAAADTATAKYHFVNNELTFTFAENAEFRFTSILTDGAGSWDGLGWTDLAAGYPTSWVKADGNDNNIKATVAGTFRMTVANGKVTVQAAS